MSDRSELEMKLLCAWNGVEELRCPHMIVLDMALQRIHSQSK